MTDMETLHSDHLQDDQLTEEQEIIASCSTVKDRPDANYNSLQAFLTKEKTGNSEKKESKIETSQEDKSKSLFLKTFNLSPCKLGIKKVQLEKNEDENPTVSDVVIDTQIPEVLNTEMHSPSFEYSESRYAKKEVLDSTEVTGFKIDETNYVVEVSDVQNGGLEKIPDKKRLLTISEDKFVEMPANNCAGKDVHFSSPLAVVHEYTVSQPSCSQSTVSLNDSDESQTSDEDNVKHTRETSDIRKPPETALVSETKTAVHTVTPGGFSAQITVTIDSTEETRTSKKSTQESQSFILETLNKIIDCVTAESQNRDKLSLAEIEKENLNIENPASFSLFVAKEPVVSYISETGVALVTNETFNKYCLASQCSDQILEISQKNISEDSFKDMDAGHFIPLESTADSFEEKSEFGLKQIKFDTLIDGKSDKEIDEMEMTKLNETTMLTSQTVKANSNLASQSLSNTDKNMSSSPRTINSYQDAFDSNLAKSTTDDNSDQNILSSSNYSKYETEDILSAKVETEESDSEKREHGQKYEAAKADIDDKCDINSGKVLKCIKNVDAAKEIDNAANKCSAEDFSKDMKNSLQEDLFKNTSSPASTMNIVSQKESDDQKEIDVHTNNNQIDFLSAEDNDSSQKDLFESDIPLESINQMKEISLSTSQTKIVNEENQISAIPKLASADMMYVSSDDENEVLNVGKKRKSEDLETIQAVKIIKREVEPPVPANLNIAPRKRHNLFKNLNKNESDSLLKKAKTSKLEVQKEIKSPVISFKLKTLAEITSDVINSLEEDIIWKHKSSEHNAKQIKESNGENVEQLSSGNMNIKLILTSSDINSHGNEANVGMIETGSESLELDRDAHSSTDRMNEDRKENQHAVNSDKVNRCVNAGTKEKSVVLNTSYNLVSETEYQNHDQDKNCVFGGLSPTAGEDQLTKGLVFVSALEYHSQCSQNSSTGFEPKTISQDMVKSSQGSDGSIPVIFGADFHSVTEVYEDGLETTAVDTKVSQINYGSLLDSLVDAAVDHVVPDQLETDEQLPDPDEDVQSLFKDSSATDDTKGATKMYACDVDICDQEDRLVCKPLDQPSYSLLNMEDTTLSSYSKCFNWKYTPSNDSDSETNLPKDVEEDSSMVRITPLKTCGKPIRIGLSRKQRVNHLHTYKQT